jgi:hypothetical protein
VRLFHFSDDGTIDRFEPRPVRIPSERPPGEEWLNGALVWAVDEDHEFTFLFPRDTARVLFWVTTDTTTSDRARWIGPDHEVVAYVERDGLAAMSSSVLYRYELPPATFVPTSLSWMLVSRHAVVPTDVVRVESLPAELSARGVDVRISDDLSTLKNAWDSTVHASGLRLRNASTWR